MGLFFEDTKTGEEKKSAIQGHGFLATVLLLFLGFIIQQIFTPLAKGLSALIGHTLDPRGTVNKKVQIIQVLVIAGIFLGTVLFLYKIPVIRDMVTLSRTHTTNISGSSTILFPDRSYFANDNERKVFKLDPDGPTYVTYSGYTKNQSLSLKENFCLLVDRGEKASFSSLTPPIYAVGFEDTVTVVFKKPLKLVPRWRYILEMIGHPSYLLLDEKTRGDIVLTYSTSIQWNELYSEWQYLWMFNDGGKPIDIEAKWNEHALICY